MKNKKYLEFTITIQFLAREDKILKELGNFNKYDKAKIKWLVKKGLGLDNCHTTIKVSNLKELDLWDLIKKQGGVYL